MNYYTQYCFKIPNTTPEETQWLQKITEEQIELGFKGEDGLAGPGVHDIENWVAEDHDFFLESNENGSIELAAEIAKKFLQQFRPNGVLSFAWAATADRWRSDSFGGGAVVITAEEIRYLNTGVWITERLKELKEKGKKVDDNF